jgi:acetoacetyl-CoA synthetase
MNPLTPVYVGGTQGPCLGLSIAVYDALVPSGQQGKEVPHGTPGELVATTSFPNMPVFFWGDKQSADTTAPPGSRYHSAYFARFPHVWAHGDFICIHPATGNILFLGRADGVLNPSGIRFGSAEIYGVVERRFADRVADSLCVGQRRPTDNDEAVMLFLLMRNGSRFDEALATEIREAIRGDLSKRHVPRWIFETPDIPVRAFPPSLFIIFCRSASKLLSRPISLVGWTSLETRASPLTPPRPDNGEWQESRAAGQANRQRQHHQAERHAGQPGES